MDERKKKLRVAQFISDSGIRDRQVFYESLVEALKNDCELHFYILAGNKHFQEFLALQGISFSVLNFYPKNFFSVIFKAWGLKKALKHYDVVHTHYHDANMLGLLTGMISGVRARIYTRHHNTFFHDLKKRRSIFVNRFFNVISHGIIAPSKSVRDTLVNLEAVSPDKVTIIHHPFSVSVFGSTSKENVELIKSKYAISSSALVIGTVSSFQRIKGTHLIIEAVRRISKQNGNIQLVLANAHGKDSDEILKQLEAFAKGAVVCIPYENDIASLYGTFDILVHTPINPSAEAFGQVYTESMGYGIASVFTPAGVLPEIGIDGKNCLMVDFQDVDQIEKAILKLLLDDNLRARIGKAARKTIKEQLSIQVFRENLLSLYCSI